MTSGKLVALLRGVNFDERKRIESATSDDQNLKVYFEKNNREKINE